MSASCESSQTALFVFLAAAAGAGVVAADFGGGFDGGGALADGSPSYNLDDADRWFKGEKPGDYAGGVVARVRAGGAQPGRRRPLV